MLATTALLLGLLAAAPAPAEEPAARRIESPLDRAVAALERADYPAALPELERLAARIRARVGFRPPLPRSANAADGP